MVKIEKENLGNIFDEYSEKFTYALGLQDDLARLCRIVRFCIDTEELPLIHKAIRSLSIAHHNIEYSPNFCMEDRRLYLDMVDGMQAYYMDKASKFFE